MGVDAHKPLEMLTVADHAGEGDGQQVPIPFIDRHGEQHGEGGCARISGAIDLEHRRVQVHERVRVILRPMMVQHHDLGPKPLQ